MSTDSGANALYVRIWVWLVGLLIIGVAVFALPIPRIFAVLLIFAIATVKAVLVARNYMHMRAEHIAIYLIALIPVLLLIGMTLMLIPDIALRR
ncbi:MAG TPA: cytochrome C oxidase subunit IV family protein [Candidatus Binataceae bacterium]